MLPNSLKEGVKITKGMLGPAIIKRDKLRKAGFSNEVDRIKVGESIANRAEQFNFVPGVSNMTQEDHLAVVEKLKGKC